MRLQLERKIADSSARIARLVEAIASGANRFDEVRDKLGEARSQRAMLIEEMESIEGERVVALHPAIAEDYRRAVATLDEALESSEAPEDREETIPRIRALIRSIVITPAATGRGVDIEIEGRLARMIALATGRPVEEPGMIALERVKGIEPSS